MSLSKYVGEQEEGALKLFWGNASEFPFRGPSAPMLKEAELDNVDVVQDFHCQEFDLGSKEDTQAYHRVMDRVVNGWYVCFYRDIYRDDKTGTRKAYVEWTQRYGQYTPGFARGSVVSRIG